MKKISEFLSENFQFLMVTFSICLNRCVFVMNGLDKLSEKTANILNIFRCETISKELLDAMHSQV